MQLGELRKVFLNLPNNDFVFSEGFAAPHSYRGYYNELAIERSYEVTLADIKKTLDEAIGEQFTGYKGGEYSYDSSTPVHLSYYGNADDSDGVEFEALVGKMLLQYLSN